jgi:hypothetical protein
MTNVTYTYTDNNGKKQTTSSYPEMMKYIAKGTRPNTVYTPVVEEYPIPEEKARRRIKL